MLPIITRKEAIAHQGLTRYFTGKPCKNEHVAERYTNNCHCIPCETARCREGYRRWRKKPPELHNATMQRWRDNHREHYRAYQREYQRRYRKAAAAAELEAL